MQTLIQSVVTKVVKIAPYLPILNSIGTSRGSSRMFSRLFLRQQRAGYVYNWPGAWPEIWRNPSDRTHSFIRVWAKMDERVCRAGILGICNVDVTRHWIKGASMTKLRPYVFSLHLPCQHVSRGWCKVINIMSLHIFLLPTCRSPTLNSRTNLNLKKQFGKISASVGLCLLEYLFIHYCVDSLVCKRLITLRKG